MISVLGTTEQLYDIDNSVLGGISSSITIATTNVSPNGMGLNAQFALPNAFIVVRREVATFADPL